MFMFRFMFVIGFVCFCAQVVAADNPTLIPQVTGNGTYIRWGGGYQLICDNTAVGGSTFIERNGYRYVAAYLKAVNRYPGTDIWYNAQIEGRELPANNKVKSWWCALNGKILKLSDVVNPPSPASFMAFKIIIITNSQYGDRDGDGVPDDEDYDPDDPDVQDEEDVEEDPNDPNSGGGTNPDGALDWLEWRKNFEDTPFITSILDSLAEDRTAAVIEISLDSLSSPFGDDIGKLGEWGISFSATQAPVITTSADTDYVPIPDETWVLWLGYINLAFQIVLFLGFVKLIMNEFSSL